jgi:hypothetical protein
VLAALSAAATAESLAVATTAPLLLSLARLAGRAAPVSVALLLLGAIYVVPEGDRAIPAPIYGGALLLIAELAFWSLDERLPGRVEPGTATPRLLAIAGADRRRRGRDPRLYRRPHRARPLSQRTGTQVVLSRSLATVMQSWAEAELHYEAGLAANTGMGARPLARPTEHDYARMLHAGNDRGERERAQALLDAAQGTTASSAWTATRHRPPRAPRTPAPACDGTRRWATNEAQT